MKNKSSNNAIFEFSQSIYQPYVNLNYYRTFQEVFKDNMSKLSDILDCILTENSLILTSSNPK